MEHLCIIHHAFTQAVHFKSVKQFPLGWWSSHSRSKVKTLTVCCVDLSQSHCLCFVPKQTSPTPSSTSPLPQWNEVDLEEQQLRQRLHEMTDNISDHSLTSDDEDEPERPHSSQEILAWRSPQADPRPSKLPIRPTSRASIVVSRLEEEQPQQTESLKVQILWHFYKKSVFLCTYKHSLTVCLPTKRDKRREHLACCTY